MTADLDPLRDALSALIDWMRDERMEGVIVGGVASSILGRPRATRDVDAMLWLDPQTDLAAVVKSAARFEVVPRVDDVVGFAVEARVLLLRHAPTAIDLDVSLGALEFERAVIAQSSKRRFGSLLVPVPRPEDIVVMKAIANRPRDVADIEGILDANPAFDREYTRSIVSEFAGLLEQPEILASLESILQRKSA